MSQERKFRRAFNKGIKNLNNNGSVKSNGITFVAGGAILNVFKSESMTEDEKSVWMNNLRHCKISVTSKEEKLVIIEILKHYGMNPTDKKFSDLT